MEREEEERGRRRGRGRWRRRKNLYKVTDEGLLGPTITMGFS